MEKNKIAKGLTALESSFSSSDVGNKKIYKEVDSKRKVGETISLNIGTPYSPNSVKIGSQCTDEEKLKFSELLHEFQYFFPWYYEDLCGFDPYLIQYPIPIKEGIKSDRQKKNSH
jgi:hypothetical protein